MTNELRRRVGILGGFSHVSTNEYYMQLHHKYYARRQDYYYPEIVVYSLDFQKFTDLENSGDLDAYAAYSFGGIRALADANVDFVLMAANSPHAVFGRLAAQSPVPMLSILDVTLLEARRRRLQSLLLLGIKFTMQSSFYADRGRELGVQVISPSVAHQDEIDRIIFGELSLNVISDASRKRLVKIIARYDVEGAILGCTELPLILRPDDAPIPCLDTIDLHTEAALNWALGLESPVSWPGKQDALAAAGKVTRR